MNSMKKYSVGGILTSLFLTLSIFTLFSISEVDGAEVISASAMGYENTIIIEFTNESTSNIKSINMWLGGDYSFKSFKTESGWGGGEYSGGKMLIFTATNILSPGESVKFGLTTNEKVNGVNWKALDQNSNEIAGPTKVSIQAISETTSSFAEESKEVGQETTGELYGTKKFIPDTLRIGSDLRLVGNGFTAETQLQLHLDDNILKSVKTDSQGNFLTTISIPTTNQAGVGVFTIRDESGNAQSTNINIEEAKNRFLQTARFEVNNIPAQVGFDEKLVISGNAYPQSAIIIQIEDMDRILEKVRVVTANSNGDWVYEEDIDRTTVLGSKYFIFQNNLDKTTKNLSIKTGSLIDISTSAVRYDLGETVSIIGLIEPNKDTTIWVKDNDKKIAHYDLFRSPANGNLDYEFILDERFSGGTYTVVIKQDDVSDAGIFGINQYPAPSIIALMDKTNFALHSKAILNILGPASTKISITILDTNDNIELTDSTTTSTLGKNKYVIDLTGLSSGVYRAVAASSNIQDAVKFSVGLESGSGEISLTATHEKYSPGESILILGNTGNNARLTVTLFDPTGTITGQTEIFSDTAGNFSTEDLGIPYNAELGTWKLTAQSRLDSKTIDIDVSIPTETGLTLQIEQTEYSTGDIVTIDGIGQTDDSRLQIKIINDSDETVITLETPISSDGTFSLPWTIPNSLEPGTYTIKVSDSENYATIVIFIQ